MHFFLPLFPASSFPDSDSAESLKGFIETFNFTLDSETVEVGFTMSFRQANIFP